jgi:outer membrane protein TolC
MKPRLSLLTVCLLLSACGSPVQRPDSGVQPPAAWQSPAAPARNNPWWTQFGSPELDRLIEQARVGSFDLAAAVARVRQAQAGTVIAGAPQLPEVKAGLNANRQKLLRGNGYSQLDANSSNKAVDYFDTNLSASYEIDFWGGKRASRDSARSPCRQRIRPGDGRAECSAALPDVCANLVAARAESHRRVSMPTHKRAETGADPV